MESGMSGGGIEGGPETSANTEEVAASFRRESGEGLITPEILRDELEVIGYDTMKNLSNDGQFTLAQSAMLETSEGARSFVEGMQRWTEENKS